MSTKDKKKKFSIGKIIKNNAYMLNLIRKAAPGYLTIDLLSYVIDAVAYFLMNIFLYYYVLNAVQQGQGIKEIIPILVLVFVVAVIKYVYFQITHYCRTVAHPKIVAYIKTMLHKKAAEVELNCFENTDFYDKYVKATEEATGRAFDVLWAFEYTIYCIISAIGNLSLMLTIDPVFIFLAAIPFPLTLIVGKLRNKVEHESDMKWREAVRQRDYVRRTFYLSDFSQEMRLTEMWKVMFGRMRKSVAELKAIIKKYGYKKMLLDYSFDIIFDIISQMFVIILALYKTLLKKTMLVGDCFVIIRSTTVIACSFGDIAGMFVEFDKHSRYIETFREFLDYETKIPEIADSPTAPSLECLEIRNVSFSYANQEDPALKNMSFKVKKGEKIAIVGHNGAGKTTLTKLLLRLYDPSEGEILLNGENIRNFRVSSYRNLYGTVFQDYGLFAVSVAENVLMRGNVTEADKEIVVDSLEKSGVWDKISTLPNGVDTTVTKEFDKDGAVFSGGETQKISIASIFAGENEIVIMDEPTSALDPIAEHKMYESMFKACEGKTVIFISHRLSATTYADRIYMFEHGQIIEQGTHGELLSLNGKFADMWHKQADNYTEKGGLKNEKD